VYKTYNHIQDLKNVVMRCVPVYVIHTFCLQSVHLKQVMIGGSVSKICINSIRFYQRMHFYCD